MNKTNLKPLSADLSKLKSMLNKGYHLKIKIDCREKFSRKYGTSSPK